MAGVLTVNAYAGFRPDATAEVIDRSTVKVVTDPNDHALMFSRHPIPYPRSGHATYQHQLGLYAFTRDSLHVFHTLRQGPLEQAEGVEMPRLLEHGYGLRMVRVSNHGIAIDTPDDLARATSTYWNTNSVP